MIASAGQVQVHPTAKFPRTVMQMEISKKNSTIPAELFGISNETYFSKTYKPTFNIFAGSIICYYFFFFCKNVEQTLLNAIFLVAKNLILLVLMGEKYEKCGKNRLI